MRESREPRLSDLRESGAIEQDADLVLFLWRERDKPGEDESADGEVVNLRLAKHRNGPTGEVKLWFRKSQTRFVSYAASATPRRSESRPTVATTRVAAQEDENSPTLLTLFQRSACRSAGSTSPSSNLRAGRAATRPSPGPGRIMPPSTF